MYDEDRPYAVVCSYPAKSERRAYWRFASSLQQCDGLRVSAYAEQSAQRYIDGELDSDALKNLIEKKYASEPLVDRQAEADIVSGRIVALLESDVFVLSPGTLLGIHATLFEGVFKTEWDGSLPVENISKKELCSAGAR